MPPGQPLPSLSLKEGQICTCALSTGAQVKGALCLLLTCSSHSDGSWEEWKDFPVPLSSSGLAGSFLGFVLALGLSFQAGGERGYFQWSCVIRLKALKRQSMLPVENGERSQIQKG